MPLRLLRCVGALVSATLITAACPEPVQAQDTRVEAREAFLNAAQAAEEERWADALQGFERAYLLSGVPTALYNAAMVLRALGRHREARDAFRSLLGDHPEYEAREEAQTLLNEEAARVAVLELVGLEGDVTYTLRLDGRVVETERELETDAGQHRIEADREGYQTFSWDGALRDGERRQIQVVMDEIERITEERRPLSKSPAFWIITGVVVIGAAILTGVLLQRRAQLDASGDNVLRIP